MDGFYVSESPVSFASLKKIVVKRLGPACMGIERGSMIDFNVWEEFDYLLGEVDRIDTFSDTRRELERCKAENKPLIGTLQEVLHQVKVYEDLLIVLNLLCILFHQRYKTEEKKRLLRWESNHLLDKIDLLLVKQQVLERGRQTIKARAGSTEADLFLIQKRIAEHKAKELSHLAVFHFLEYLTAHFRGV